MIYKTHFMACVTAALTLVCLMFGAELHASSTQSASPDEAKFWFNLRLRNESVDIDNNLDDAHAMTLKSTLGFESERFAGFKLLLEAENVTALDDRYNSTTNGETGRNVVVDPTGTELNRAQLQFNKIPKTSVTVGRQKIIYDNARFVGNVGWRQNEQTFDAVRVDNTAIPNTKVSIAYIDKVRRIFGSDSPVGKTDMSSPLINIKYSGFNWLSITAYGYFLDFDDDPGRSNKTVGMRFSGKRPVGPFVGHFLLEYADQSNFEDGNSTIDASYRHLRAGIKFSKVDVSVGQEVLGGDGVYGFQTPLATGHAFNGWSDRFLATPVNGLVDTYVSATTAFKKIKIKAAYHEFDSDHANSDYGSEFNVVATRSFGDKVSAGVKFAHYNSREFGVDAQKYWLFAQYRF